MPSSTWTSGTASTPSANIVNYYNEFFRHPDRGGFPQYRVYGTSRLDTWTFFDGSDKAIADMNEEELKEAITRLSTHDSCGDQRNKIVSLERVLGEKTNAVL